ncbi:RNA polymerase recycling motor HelD [Neobacillus sp. LXY-4]|uniref:RNA polymerase recycling motor HelD n=1 Tax=Neobacillus sp. LXY-4 TaxID=3379826 RepID=UPI003EE2E24B
MSAEQNKEWHREQARVKEIIKEVENKMGALIEKGGHIVHDVRELRETFWNDVTVNLDEPDDVIETHTSLRQQAELLSERERSHSQIERQMNTLVRLKNTPYFGRIDFLEEGEIRAESIYIGISSFMDKEEQNFLIYDWRAPISSLYYDYPPGPAHYSTPSGMISGEMELKRQFIIKFGTITGMFDTGITIRDEMLQAVLGNNTDTQMKSIVATIQKEQNQIIRNEKSKIVIVQGVAGSGKTSAALQRVAYLLYRYRESLLPENIILFSPNPLFNSYVSTVLPELGEENMQQSTFQEYLDRRLSKEFKLEDSFDQMEYVLTSSKDPAYEARLNNIQFKSGIKFKDIIDAYVQKLANQGLIFNNFTFRRRIIISEEQINQYFYNLDRSYSIPNRIQIVKEWLFKELKKRIKLEQKKKWVEEEIQYLDKDDFIEVYQQLEEKGGFSENTFDDFEREQELLAEMYVKQKFKPLFNRVKNLNFVNMKENYLRLFDKNLEDTPSNWEGICDLTIDSVKNNTILYEDATPFVYLQDLLLGRRTNNSIRHIFIDEAQDYSPFQFAFIKQMFPYSKMTLLGDINQAIYTHSEGSDMSLPNRIDHTELVETYNLNTTYRSTKEIVDFTSCLIVGGDKIEPFNRSGSKPSIEVVQTRDELHLHLVEQIHLYLENGHNTIAIICKTAKECQMAFNALKDKLSLRLIGKGTIAFETGVVVIPAYLAKGIEFDAVIIYDSSQYAKESERKLFYTACTRAMHDLHIAAVEEISALMGDVPKEKYTVG